MSDPTAPVLSEWRGVVMLVTLNRPRASNAMNPAMLRELSRVWAEASEEKCRAVVITGAGRNFCAGADLAAATANSEEMSLRRAFHPQLLAFAALNKPVIAAINGAAAGGGLSLALAADIRIMAEDARLVPAWVQIGLAPDLGASWFAPRLLGEARTFEWFASGEAMSAERAVAFGVASKTAPPDSVVECALERAQMLASQPGNAVALTKKALAEARGAKLADQLETEIGLQQLAHQAPNRREQVAARMARFAKKHSDEGEPC